MELQLVPAPEPAVAEAARRALAAVVPASRPPAARGRWWRVGIADAVEARTAAWSPAGYGTVASPRSTRGATRA